jgi:nucleoside-diphosphate-sugar epimerase
MRYLIVGATGYIGSYLTNHMRDLGIEYLEASRTKNAKKSSDLFFCDIDSEQYDDLNKLKNVQGIIFLAWPNLDRMDRDSVIHLEFRLKAQKFISAMIDRGLKRIIVSGTCEEYGLHEGICSESQTIYPINQYGIQKDEFHNWIREQQLRVDIQLLWLRFFYLYGENPRRNTLFQEIIRSEASGDSIFSLTTSGNQERDYLHVNEATKVAALLLANESTNGVVNIGSGSSSSLKALMSFWKMQNKWKIDFSYDEDVFPINEPKVQFADVSKLHRLL